MPLNLAYATGSGVTVGTTEMSLATDGGTTTGVPQSKTDQGIYELWLDPLAMQKGDEFELSVYEKAVSGGTQRKVFDPIRLKWPHTQLLVLPSLKLGVGWDITLKKVAGTDRAFSWSIRRVS